MESMEQACKDAIQKAGGSAELARELGIDRTTPAHWKKVPPTQVLRVSELTGISVFKLRPDVFGSPDDMKTQLRLSGNLEQQRHRRRN